MHLRSPAGPISVYVLNPPDSDSMSSIATSVSGSETVPKGDSTAQQGSDPELAYDGDTFQSRLIVVGQNVETSTVAAAEGRGGEEAPMEIDSENPIPNLNSQPQSHSGSRVEIKETTSQTATVTDAGAQGQETTKASEFTTIAHIERYENCMREYITIITL